MAYLIKNHDGTVQLVANGVFSRAVEKHEEAVALIHEAVEKGEAGPDEKMKLLAALRRFGLPQTE